jgi:putative sigma-54 modulation protein
MTYTSAPIITVSGHHIEITDALKNYVLNKFSGLEKRFKAMTSIDVVLSADNKKKHSFTAEATVHLSHAVLNASDRSTDMYACIDAIAHKLERQVVKHKEKIQNHHPHHRDMPSIEEEQS